MNISSNAGGSNRRRGSLFWAAIPLASAFLATASQPAVAQDQAAALVVVDQVRKEPLKQTIPILGRLVARKAGVVAALTRGAVAEFRVDVGDRVKKGQVIAVLATDRLRWERRLKAAEVTQANAALKTARAKLDLVKQALKRLEGLRKSAAFSQARQDDKRLEVATATSATAEAMAAVERAKANLRLAEIEVRNAKILAPYPGVVSYRHTEVGSYLNVGADVVTLIDDQSLEIEADVPAERVPGLVPGTKVFFRLAGRLAGRSNEKPIFPAKVRAVVPEENPLTRTRTVRFTPSFDKPQSGLAASQGVTLQLPAGAAREVLSVHKDAILNRKGKSMVFVVEGEMARIRPIVLGEAVGGRFEVLSGLKPGDLVVVRGNERLLPEQKVRYPGSSGS